MKHRVVGTKVNLVSLEV